MSALTVQEATANLMRSMRRALVERREVVDIDAGRFRFQRRGEEFFDNHGNGFQALESGLFVFYPMSLGDQEVGGKWIHLGSTDDLEDHVKPYIAKLSAMDIEGYAVGLSAAAALRSAPPRRPRP